MKAAPAARKPARSVTSSSMSANFWPSFSTGSEAHAPGTIESLIVVHGEVEITAGREAPRILRKGDAIVFETDAPHRYVNLGQAPTNLHLVMSYANLIDVEQPF